MIIGRIHDTVKLAGLTAKWEQKKQNIGKKQKEMTPEERQLEQFKEQMKDIRKSNETNAITSKIHSGEKLTPEEIEYLRKENPQALQAYEEIQKEKENYKNQLKNCKTKEDVEKLKQQKLGEFMAAAKKADSSPYIPKEQKLAIFAKILAKIMVVEEAHYEFTKSLAYQSLPTEEEKQQAEKAMREQKLPEVEAERMENVKVENDVGKWVGVEDEKAEIVIGEMMKNDETQLPECTVEAEESEVPELAVEVERSSESYNPQDIRRDIENMLRKYEYSSKKVNFLA